MSMEPDAVNGPAAEPLGPGWFRGPDGYYPPARHPDPNHRAMYVTQAAPSVTTAPPDPPPSPPAETVVASPPATATAPPPPPATASAPPQQPPAPPQQPPPPAQQPPAVSAVPPPPADPHRPRRLQHPLRGALERRLARDLHRRESGKGPRPGPCRPQRSGLACGGRRKRPLVLLQTPGHGAPGHRDSGLRGAPPEHHSGGGADQHTPKRRTRSLSPRTKRSWVSAALAWVISEIGEANAGGRCRPARRAAGGVFCWRAQPGGIIGVRAIRALHGPHDGRRNRVSSLDADEVGHATARLGRPQTGPSRQDH